MCKQGAGGDLAQQAPKINLYKQGVGETRLVSYNIKELEVDHTGSHGVKSGAISSSYSDSKDL